MARPRLKLCGIASVAEARLAAEVGADIIGLEAGTGHGMAPDGGIAEIALALPPGVSAAILSHALTAGTIAQQVDAAAAGVVQLQRPLDASEYPGLKRIIRGRKIIQVLPPGSGAAAVEAYAGLADAIELQQADLATIGDPPVPVFLAGVADPAALARAVATLRPYGLALALPRTAAGEVDHPRLAALIGALRQAGSA